MDVLIQTTKVFEKNSYTSVKRSTALCSNIKGRVPLTQNDAK